MLSVYRRHRAKCPQGDDRISKKCRCALWAKGTIEGKPYQKSLKTRNFERAQQIIRDIERGNIQEEKSISITHALDAYISESVARNLSVATLAKYRQLSGHLKVFGQDRSITRLADFTTDSLRDFRRGRNLAPRTSGKELERIRTFFAFCIAQGWITANPAKAIKAPEVKPNPTLPFSDGELVKIFASADFRTSIFFRVLLNTGLRIIDAAQLRPEKIINGKIFLYTQKTGVPVLCPIPPDLLDDLKKLPLTGGFFFAVESENPVTIAEYYRVKLKKIDPAFHPHRFRDTAAVRWLMAGIDIPTVATLLGNSARIVEKHYAPWVKDRQDRAEQLIRATWKPALQIVSDSKRG